MESEIYVEQEMAEQRVDVRREAVIYQGGGGAVDSVNGQTGDVVLTTSDIENTSDYQTGSDVSNSINDAMSTLATVASTGDYSDLSNTPTIPTAVSQLQNDSGYQTSSEVDASILVETTAREGADNNLQRQIDAISASSDVTDIVGTYAALQAYDTSTLGDNDIIKVLQDESRNNETTYYRWSTASQTFTLIGEEGPYYTKSEANSTFQGKLTAGSNINIDANNEISATDTTYTAGTGLSLTGTAFSVDTTAIQEKLTAGTNITIANDNTISATDTTYSDFTGTDGQTAGTAGLVPAPATTDDGKYLKADGTWGTVQAGPTIVQTTGTSTTDVMSQDATTKMVYPNITNSPSVIVVGSNIGSLSNNAVGLGKRLRIAYGSVSIGFSANSSGGSESVSIGPSSISGADYAIAVGSNAASYSQQSVALGFNSSVSSGRNNAVALGAYSVAGRASEVSVGATGGSNPITRYIANVKDPQLAQDAATKNYVDNRIVGSGTAAPTTSTAGSVGSLYAYVENGTGHLAICTAVSGTTYTWQTLI